MDETGFDSASGHNLLRTALSRQKQLEPFESITRARAAPERIDAQQQEEGAEQGERHGSEDDAGGAEPKSSESYREEEKVRWATIGRIGIRLHGI